MLNLVTKALVSLGALVALFGIGIDFLLPGTSPGFNLPQLLIVAAGAAVAFTGVWMRRRALPSWLRGSRPQSLATVLIVTLVTLIALEIILTAWGMPTYHHAHVPQQQIAELPWWTCDAAGCHYVQEEVERACESGELKDRYCLVNGQGYADSKEFIAVDPDREPFRVLLLGDSFTFGMSADVGMSFAERLSTDLPQLTIWNTGIIGAGTSQALAAFKTYAPLLRPQLTILGFYENDFNDNLIPLGGTFWAVAESNGNIISLSKYRMDKNEQVREVDTDALRYYVSYWKYPSETDFERQLGLTRLGTLLLRLRDAVETKFSKEEQFSRRIEVTREYLRALDQAAAAAGSELLVLMIPDRPDYQSIGPRFRNGLELMQELGIPFINPISILDPVAHHAEPPDDHWNNAGHQTVADILGDCFLHFFASGGFADCAQIVMP